MSQESMYFLLLALMFFAGLVCGVAIVLWGFAKDKTIQKISDEDMVVKKKDWEQIKRRLNFGSDE